MIPDSPATSRPSTGVFDEGVTVYWFGQAYRVWWISEMDPRRRWIRHLQDGHLKVVDIDELSLTPPHRHISAF